MNEKFSYKSIFQKPTKKLWKFPCSDWCFNTDARYHGDEILKSWQVAFDGLEGTFDGDYTSDILVVFPIL